MGEAIRRKGEDITKEHKVTLGSHGYVHYLNGDDSFIGIYIEVKIHQIVQFKYVQVIRCQYTSTELK